MPPDRKPPSTSAVWITVALLAVLVAYPLSFGPACWWFCRPVSAQDTDLLEGTTDERMTFHFASRVRVRMGCSQVIFVPKMYWPLGWIACTFGDSADAGLVWYGRLGLPHRTAMLIPAQRNNLLR